MLRLEPELTIIAAAAQRERLLSWLADTAPAAGATPPPTATLDLSAVESFDSAGLQLLLATRHSLAERGQALHLHGTPGVVRDALSVVGLQSLADDGAATDPSHPHAAPAAGAQA